MFETKIFAEEKCMICRYLIDHGLGFDAVRVGKDLVKILSERRIPLMFNIKGQPRLNKGVLFFKVDAIMISHKINGAKKLMVVQNKHQDPPDNNDERRENTLATRPTAALTAIRSMTT